MHQTCITRTSASHPLMMVLTTMGIGALCSGCFVIRHEQSSKPIGPAESVKFHRIQAGFETYSRVLGTSDADMEVSVANWPSGWELQFLLNVVPIYRYHYGRTEPLSVEVEVEPKTSGLTLDPGKIFFLGADQVRLPPAKIRYGRSTSGRYAEPDPGEAVSITNCTTFHLEFPVEYRAYPEHDLPFQLFVEGFSVASRAVPMTSITFEPETRTRPAFRLPY